MMSVEEQLSNAVQACNNLTAAINGKVAQIDQKVDAAVKAIPELHKSFFVDAVNGNDTALGTQASPIKTIFEAAARTPVNGSVAIYLMRNQDHIMSGGETKFTNITNKTVTLRPYGSGDKPVIKMAVGGSASGSILYGFLVSDFCRVTVIECVVDTMALDINTSSAYSNWGGFVSRDGTVGEVGAALISVSHSEIRLRDHHFSSHYTRVDYNFRAVVIDHVGSKVQLNSGGDTFYCTFNGVSLTDTTKTLKDCLSGANENNTLTNISMAAA
ncbi:hypothetical protein B5W74_21995 [Salmonella enterica]|nr:hypothetical protein [Salmonella enterica]